LIEQIKRNHCLNYLIDSKLFFRLGFPELVMKELGEKMTRLENIEFSIGKESMYIFRSE